MDQVMSDCVVTPAVVVTGLGSSAPRPNEAASLSALWTELVSGFCKIEGGAFTAQTCSLLVTRGHRAASAERERLPLRDIEIMERSLIEGVRKSVAVDFGLCPSSVAEILRRCLVFMGLSCWPSRIPLLLVMAVHAKRGFESNRAAKLILAQNQQFSRQTISAVRPDNELESWLSPAEYAVTRLLIEGKSYAELANLRGTSKRTVANQLASAFHRLHISGRAELLCLLAKRQLATWQQAVPPERVAAAVALDVASGFARVAGDRGR